MFNKKLPNFFFHKDDATLLFQNQHFFNNNAGDNTPIDTNLMDYTDDDFIVDDFPVLTFLFFT